MKATKTLLLLLLLIFIAKDAKSQKSKIYYSFPDEVALKLNNHIDSTIDLTKKHFKSKVYLVVSKYDTTKVLIASYDDTNSRFKFIISNTNRFFKAHIKGKNMNIPIVLNTDFSLSESLNFKEFENGIQVNTKILIRVTGYLIGFIVRKNIAYIVQDNYIVE